MVELLLTKGANVHDKHKDGIPSLHIAFREGHLKVVGLLLSRGASTRDKDKDGYTPLSIASHLGHFEIVNLLLSKRARAHGKDYFGATPLHAASHQGHLEIAELLLSKRASVYDRTNDGRNSLVATISEEVKSVLLNWGATMAILVLQELRVTTSLLSLSSIFWSIYKPASIHVIILHKWAIRIRRYNSSCKLSFLLASLCHEIYLLISKRKGEEITALKITVFRIIYLYLHLNNK